MSVKLALLCRDGYKLDLVSHNGWNINTMKPNQALFKTHAWVISQSKVDGLIGSNVVLCPSTTGSAYIGGQIVSYEVDENNKVSITFKEDDSLVGYNVQDWLSQNPVKYL